MLEQRSFDQKNQGTLFLVATPIGNLGDITYRAVETLQQADCIAAEDTRHTRKLLSHLDIHPPALVSYHEHNKKNAGESLLERLQNGQRVALVSDAGTPAIADPGYELVCAATEAGITVVSIPGPNAAISALIASGIAPQPFLFHGFLARDKNDAKKELANYLKLPAALIFYEAPHRLKSTLAICLEVFGNRQATLVRELTKKHEHFLRGTLSELLDWTEREEVRGECCFIVAPISAEQARVLEEEACIWKNWTIQDHVAYYVGQGQAEKEAMRLVAKERGMRKREIYQILLGEDVESP